MLPFDAIHPKLKRKYESLKRIVEDRPGMLGEHPILTHYLGIQIEMLKTRDVMFARDFAGNSATLINSAIDEMQELSEEVPILNGEVLKLNPISASSEGGDVIWFLGMRVGLGYLDKSNKLGVSEGNLISGFMGIIDGIAKIYPEFDPKANASAAKDKNVLNWPDRVLRAAPNTSIDVMARVFEKERKMKLKSLRGKLNDRKITPPIYESIQKAESKMPKVPEAQCGAQKRYRDVVVYAREASQYYAYPR
ncbi:hypothetical protein DYH11_03290 [Candidatus Microgenomates bacterium CPR3]|nr:hypothetical protein [Candidatus Microgenomates bacterium CPR3]